MVADIGETNNNDAPKLVRANKAPSRKQKPFYIQDKYAKAFDKLAFDQKQLKRKRAPELAEEALDLLFQQYGLDMNSL